MSEENVLGRKRMNHTWSSEEDKALVDCLLESGLEWKGENGFRPGYAVHLEKMMQDKIPGCMLKANPHITSRIKHLKRNYSAICEMLGPNGSGFGWNDKSKMIEVEKGVYTEWVKSHPNAKGLFKKPFPYFEELGSIFGRDVATGQSAHDAGDAIEDMDVQATMMDDSMNVRGDDSNDIIRDNTQATSNHPMAESANEDGIEHSVPASASVTVPTRGKKRRRSDDDAMAVVADAMKDLTQTYSRNTDKIDKLVECFSTPTETIPPQEPSIMNELKKFEELGPAQRIQVAMILSKDSSLEKIFMQSDQEEQAIIVGSLLPPPQ